MSEVESGAPEEIRLERTAWEMHVLAFKHQLTTVGNNVHVRLTPFDPNLPPQLHNVAPTIVLAMQPHELKAFGEILVGYQPVIAGGGMLVPDKRIVIPE